MSLLRELTYDIEDVIDKFIHKLGTDGHQHHGGFKEFFRKTARRLKTLGSRRKRVKSSYKLDDIPCQHSSVDPRLSALFVEEAHLVGIDGPRDDLASWMLQDESSLTKHRKVLSIVGFWWVGENDTSQGGLSQDSRGFSLSGFISVSQKPNVKKIMKDLISQLHCKKDFKEGIDTWDEPMCIAKLKRLLHDKRYLIVIDDIWSISAWDNIKCAFPENEFSSRIIVTTRVVDVARSCSHGGNGRMYEMEALNDLHSKRLFFKRIFGSEDRCPDVLKQVSYKILKKCGGLPLAIISISSLLATKPVVKDEWERVRRSIGSALDKGRSLDGMNNILSLSYNDLSPNLKTCLLYLCIYPEDYVIERDILVRRWIAEGFISKEREQSKQEVAENHFYELINKSMVQPVDIGYDGKARACQVHDMMLELIISKSVEDNFISLAGHGQTDLAKCDGLIRRLSIQHIDQELAFILANEDLSHVRSLTVIASTCIKHLPKLVGFEALRVLEFQDCKNLHEYDMNGIDKLFQLKYLSFRGTDMSKLPSEIVRLYGLETLDLRDTRIEELPTGIIQLVKLQHLLIARYPYGLCPYGETKIPNGIGNMRDLPVISGFNIIKSSLCPVEELGNLSNLKELHLQLDGRGCQEYKRHEEMLLSSLCKLGACKLQSLRIVSDEPTPLQFVDSWSPLPDNLQIFWMTTGYYLPKMPKWIVPALTSLAYLNINLTEATEEDLRILGDMPALLHLGITFRTVQKERLTVQGVAFPCLKEFNLIRTFRCESAVYLSFEEGALPKLEKLELPFYVPVAEAYGFYLGLGHLPFLRDAIVTLCNDVKISSESSSAAYAAIRKEANSHPNRPRYTPSRCHLPSCLAPSDVRPGQSAGQHGHDELSCSRCASPSCSRCGATAGPASGT
uniref:NBS-LRR disease resistance protein n=1 Tax=Dasypyrum villosum TaxID=40247 RepID=A0A8K1MIW4_9POAL|nr:NBS-LRR disease resistance protein [Dasypyrum villosum]